MDCGPPGVCAMPDPSPLFGCVCGHCATRGYWTPITASSKTFGERRIESLPPAAIGYLENTLAEYVTKARELFGEPVLAPLRAETSRRVAEHQAKREAARQAKAEHRALAAAGQYQV